MTRIFLAIVGPRPDPYPDATAGLDRWPAPGPMPRPRVLLLVDDSNCAIVYAYAADGTFAGDQWYVRPAEAMQAEAGTYGDDLGPWREVPFTDLNDAVIPALREAARLDDPGGR